MPREIGEIKMISLTKKEGKVRGPPFNARSIERTSCEKSFGGFQKHRDDFNKSGAYCFDMEKEKVMIGGQINKARYSGVFI